MESACACSGNAAWRAVEATKPAATVPDAMSLLTFSFIGLTVRLLSLAEAEHRTEETTFFPVFARRVRTAPRTVGVDKEEMEYMIAVGFWRATGSEDWRSTQREKKRELLRSQLAQLLLSVFFS